MNDYPTDLRTPLLKFSSGRKSRGGDYITLKQAVEGFHILGAIGSGKTSGSGQTLARTFLANGFGGLVLTVKNDEIETWTGKGDKTGKDIGHLKAAGREKDAVIMDINSNYTFNPFEYEMTRPDGLGRRTSNLRDLLLQMYLIGLAFKGKNSGGSKDPHWDDIRDECLNRTIDLLKLAGEEVSPLNMRKLVSTMPQEKDRVLDYLNGLSDKKEADFNEWITHRSNYCFYCLNKAVNNSGLTDDELMVLNEFVDPYFLEEYPTHRTDNERGSIQSSFNTMIEPFKDPEDILRQFFSKGVSDELRPEACYEEGKIIILNFPTDIFGVAANYAQTLYKLVWQNAMSRRDLNTNNRPVFLWIDECSKFVNTHDANFFSKCRSKRVSSVLLNQTLPNYYTYMGGKSAHDAVDSLIGQLQTKIFHQNDCYRTNEWAAKTIGKSDFETFSTTINSEMRGSASRGERTKFKVDPEAFQMLEKGGGRDLVVESIILTGEKFADGSKHQKVFFDQTFMT